jgi:hypothetical protein
LHLIMVRPAAASLTPASIHFLMSPPLPQHRSRRVSLPRANLVIGIRKGMDQGPSCSSSGRHVRAGGSGVPVDESTLDFVVELLQRECLSCLSLCTGLLLTELGVYMLIVVLAHILLQTASCKMMTALPFKKVAPRAYTLPYAALVTTGVAHRSSKSNPIWVNLCRDTLRLGTASNRNGRTRICCWLPDQKQKPWISYCHRYLSPSQPCASACIGGAVLRCRSKTQHHTPGQRPEASPA